MNLKKLKDDIAEGQALLDKYKKIIVGIAKLPRPSGEGEITMQDHHYNGTLLVLDIESIKITERIPQIEERLTAKRKEYDLAFENMSVEVNTKMHIVVNEAKQHFDKEPFGVTSKMKELVSKYEAGVEQEEKNEIYDSLKSHNAFMKKVKR